MKLTKKQRHEVYKKALKFLPIETFACHAVVRAVNSLGLSQTLLYYEDGCSPEGFPELFLFREINYSSAWLSVEEEGFCSRTDGPHWLIMRQVVLNFCIEMTR